MTHKRIRTTEINEILFTIEGEHGHGMCTFARTNKCTNLRKFLRSDERMLIILETRLIDKSFIQ